MEGNKNPSSHLNDKMLSTFNIRRFIYASYYQKPLMSQILIIVLEIFLTMRMLTVPTPLDHMYVHTTLDTLEMDKLAQVILISFFQCPEKFFMTREEQFSLLLFLYIQSQLFEAGSNLKRPFNSNYGAGSNQIFILKCSSTEHSIVGCDVVRLIPIRHRRVFNTEYLR